MILDAQSNQMSWTIIKTNNIIIDNMMIIHSNISLPSPNSKFSQLHEVRKGELVV